MYPDYERYKNILGLSQHGGYWEKTSNPFAAHVKLNKQESSNSDAYITKIATAIGSHMYAIIATSSSLTFAIT